MIKVIKIEPNKTPEILEIPNKLEVLQKIVGGYIGTVNLGKDYILICNEEGLLLKLQPNLKLPRIGVIVGTVFITKSDGEGEFVSINENEVEDVIKIITKYQI